jgi:hypothetical protein
MVKRRLIQLFVIHVHAMIKLGPAEHIAIRLAMEMKILFIQKAHVAFAPLKQHLAPPRSATRLRIAAMVFNNVRMERMR